MSPKLVLLACLAWTAAPAPCAGGAWRTLPATEPEVIYGLCARHDTLWAGIDGGVRRSVDSGSTWSDSGSGMGPGKVAGVAAAPVRLAACQGKTLYISTDQGRTWSPRDSLPAGIFLRMDAWKDTLFAWRSSLSDSVPDGFRFSLDGGLTWKDSDTGQVALPKARVFRGDTFVFADTVLYRMRAGNREKVAGFPDPIREMASMSGRMLILTARDLYAARAATGPWFRLPKRIIPMQILAMAADSDFIATETPRGIFLSRNRGLDWELLRPNVYANFPKRLYLSQGILYISVGTAFRYSIANGTWDSQLTLPGMYRGDLLFAAGGDRMAVFGLVAYQKPAILISRDQGSHFETTGSFPYFDISEVFLVGSTGMAIGNGTNVWYSSDNGSTWTQRSNPVECYPTFQARMASLALVDSTLFMTTEGGSLWRTVWDGTGCGWESFPAPEGYPTIGNTVIFPRQDPCVAGSGHDLYYGSSSGLSVWENISALGLAKPLAPFANVPLRSHAFPVRVWNRPGTDQAEAQRNWIDAKGALRR